MEYFDERVIFVREQKNTELSFDQGLRRDLLLKGLIIPLVFAVITAVACFIMSNPALGVFPDGNYKDEEVVTVTHNEYMGVGGADIG